jgi:acyl-coenzyme A synthetase/AMP-(fatty) acid ligase
VAEVRDEEARDGGLSALARGVAAEIHRRRGVRPARVLLVRPQTIPKTSSGKIQHAALAAQVAAGGLADRILHETGSTGG